MTLACVSPAVAVPITGAAGTTGFTVKERVTVCAGSQVKSPPWSASIVQVPAVTTVRVPPDVMLQTPVVDEEKLTVRTGSEDALSVGPVPKFCAPGLLKVMVCVAAGITEFDAVEAGPVPFALVAVTVKVYETPLVRPVTVIGDVAPEAMFPPGLAVTV